MAYIAPIHQPSSIRHALKLNFLVSDQLSLVVAKANRLEIYSQSQDGLLLSHSKAVYGRITMLEKLRPASSSTDHLFVGTDRFMYFVLSWDPITKQLRTERSFVDQADNFARDSQTGDRCHFDPTANFMTLELYEGIITVIPVAKKLKKESDPEIGSLLDPIQTRIPEMFVRSSAFMQTRQLQTHNKPRLALLYQNAAKIVKLKLRQLIYHPGLGSGDLGRVDMEDINDLEEEESMDPGASHLIPVPGPAHGLLILGEVSISYYEPFSQKTIRRPLPESTFFVAWESIDNQRFVLADEYGKLYLLMLQLSGSNEVTGWKLEVIGETSRASALIYLGNGNVFVASHQGDSQVITIKPQALEIIQTLPNIAPIVDFTIMDMGSRGSEGQQNEYSSGQARLVTGSGAYKDGSLRSVRSGVGLEDLGVLDSMENITALFSLKTKDSNAFTDLLLVSFLDESRVFHFSHDGEVEELPQFGGVLLDQGTLFAMNIQNNQILQATHSTIRIVDIESGMVSSQWTPSSEQTITAVSANDDFAVAVFGGTELVALDIHQDLSTRAKRTFKNESQIACVNVSSSSNSFCLVGTWDTSAISTLSLSNLETVSQEKITNEEVSVPRELLLTNILEGAHPTLFVAMADGQVITHILNSETGVLSGRKSIVLGTQQASFRALPRGQDLFNVFATCEHPSLIYGSEGRIVYSAVTAEDASCVCPFNAESYPGAIAIATSKVLKLALVDEERGTHVQGLHIGETVRRIAYSSELRCFGLGTIHRKLVDNEEIVQSHFKLSDEVMFNILDAYALNKDEIVESVMRCELNDGTGDLAERFVVGTAYLADDTTDSIRGRLLVFEVTEERTLSIVAEHAVKGACRCLAMVEGKIVAGLIKTVVVYNFEYETASTPFFNKSASYRCSTAPIDIAVEGNTIAVTDLMKSLTVLSYTKGSGGADKLTEVGRHFQTVWGTAVAIVDQDTYLEADAEGNLLVLKQDVKGVTAEDRRRLQMTSEICLGELVNRIRRIDIPASPDAAVSPRAFIGTTEGSIHLFGLIHPSKQNLLISLQATLASYVKSPGDIPFMSYRAVHNMVRTETDPFRFVDGELVEHFLNLDETTQESIVEDLRLGVHVEDVRSLVEGLRRLR